MLPVSDKIGVFTLFSISNAVKVELSGRCATGMLPVNKICLRTESPYLPILTMHFFPLIVIINCRIIHYVNV